MHKNTDAKVLTDEMVEHACMAAYFRWPLKKSHIARERMRRAINAVVPILKRAMYAEQERPPLCRIEADGSTSIVECDRCALSAQGEAIGWGEIDHGRLVSFTASRTERNTTPLYTHPAPARVTMTDAMHVAAARAIWSIRRDEEDRYDQELEDLPPNHSVWDEARAALTAALEDGHGN